MSTDKSATLEHATLPDGKLAVVPLDSMVDFAGRIDEYIVSWRKKRAEENPALRSVIDTYDRDSFLILPQTPRFGSGEAKGMVHGSVRGDDVYILVDVCNYSITYSIGGYENVKSPDDHFQDLKRIIAAVSGAAKRITVIMPYLYEGRQMIRAGKESLDCADALQELETMGVTTIITFDAHDTRVQNAIPLIGFESFRPGYQFIKNILRAAPDLVVDREHLMVISPDEGGMRRAIYLATVLGIDMGTFYQRHDYSKKMGKESPVIGHQFLGSDVRGKDCIVIDDLISSGKTVLKTAERLKERGAGRIFICATFGMFTRGLDQFDKAFRQGLFTKLITTNLTYQKPELREKEYYINCDMRKYIALIIDTLNHDCSISELLDPIDRIRAVLEKHRNHEPI